MIKLSIGILILFLFITSCNKYKKSHIDFFHQFENRLTESDKVFMDTCSSSDIFLNFAWWGGLTKYVNFFDSIPQALTAELDSMKINRIRPVCLAFAYWKYIHKETYELQEISIYLESRLESKIKVISDLINLPIRINDSNLKILNKYDTILVTIPDSITGYGLKYAYWNEKNWENKNLLRNENLKLIILKEKHTNDLLKFKTKIIEIFSDSTVIKNHNLKAGENIVIDITNYSKYIRYLN